jgi:transposase
MRVYLGIDWSEKKHDICMMNEAGAVLQKLQIGHSLAGLSQLEEAIQGLGLSKEEVVLGLETAHTLLIDFFIDRGYGNLYVLPPSQVKSNQGRYAQSKAKDDERDSWVIADMLRTDRGRYSVWQPDSLLTRQIQVQVRYVIYLTRMIRRQCNYLRAILMRYYPLAAELFSRLDSPVALAFLQTYPTPQAARELGWEAFRTFLRNHHHTQTGKWPQLYARLSSDYPQPLPDTVTLYAAMIPPLSTQLEHFVRSKPQAIHTLQTLFAQHPDAPIYTSLPGAGDFLAPALLAHLGDDRNRYPSHTVLQAIAGTCPITIRSGKHRSILFRQACNRQFRFIVTQWAGEIIQKEPWAYAYFDRCCRAGHSKPDAVRRLANRLLVILWTLWQNRTPYNATLHLQHLAARAKPRT